MHDEITSELRLPSLDLTAAACDSDLSSAASLSTMLEECASLPGQLRARAADVRLGAQAAELLDLRARLSAVEAILKKLSAWRHIDERLKPGSRGRTR